MPQGRFKENDDFSAILKTIVKLEDEPQLQSSGHALSDDASVDQRSKRGRSSQGVLYIDFVKEEFKRLLASSKARTEAAPYNDYAFDKVRSYLTIILATSVISVLTYILGTRENHISRLLLT